MLISKKKKMQKPQDIAIEDFNYDLPDERIAKFPLEKRDESKLLLYRNGEISHAIFKQIPDYLNGGDLLVCNNTRVIQARLVFHKETGARIEVFCLEPIRPHDYVLTFQTTGECVWKCMVGNASKWKPGTILEKSVKVNDKEIIFKAEKQEAVGNAYYVRFFWEDETVNFASILDAFGVLPIPPYLHRETVDRDKITYQTVYSKIKGSVAAPTAGLHFTPEVFDALNKKNIHCEEVTLHVGAGTFQPVKSETIGDHEMHTEWISVQKSVVEKIRKAGKVIAVGTTSVRTLESLYYIGCQLAENPKLNETELKVTQWMPYNSGYNLSTEESLDAILAYMEKHELETISADTQIIIVPGYNFHIVKAIITNFHQPQSTLLLLISAFVGEDWKKMYDYAMKNGFRFLSYGDSSLLIRTVGAN
ncbi:MAG: S-adenosylmethionine:tRNA ribosyltransferase-isomerase [Paludibacteraceae bacterium]|nr:S-adenosylmethionine:tRNA ribosyltransferase-isomerase [Paludibacteraceae bacterium]